MQNNGTLLHEVTLKISTNDCFRVSVTQAFSVLQWSAMQISILYSEESVQVRDVMSLVQVLHSTSQNGDIVGRFQGYERWTLMFDLFSVVRLVKN